MAKFKVGEKVILSKRMYEECSGLEWSGRAEQKMRVDGFLIVSEVFKPRAYIMEGLPAITFAEEWLEPYMDQTPSPLHLGRAAYMPRETWLPKEEVSVRDRFAMAALSGMLAHSTRYKPREEGADWHWSIAKEAYELADAMMEARKI